MTDAYPQAVKTSMSEQAHGVTQAVLATVASVELQPRRAGGQIQLVVRQQGLFRIDFPITQRRSDRLATQIHVGGRLEQPYRLTRDENPGGFAE